MLELKNYINGKWVKSLSKKLLDVENPATGEILGRVALTPKPEVYQAINLAKNSFASWRKTPPLKRARYLFKLRDLILENFEDLARAITQEHGKILSDARGEMMRVLENIEVACGVPTFMQGKFSEDIAEGIDEYFIRVPLGVFCIVSPFNFPAMIPFWFFPYALVCGNTCIIKPSEQVPLTMHKIFKLIDKAGFPKGVINLINGNKEVVDIFLEHKDVVGISSVTSTPIAKSIYTKAAQFGKRVQCQGGAKNFSVVLPDANLEKAIPSVIDSAFGNTGQRCLAGSCLIAVGSVYEKILPLLLVAARKIKVGYGLEKEIQMGPVISSNAKNKIISYIEMGVKEGAKLLLDGRKIKIKNHLSGHFLGPTIFTEVKEYMTIAKEEIFGPVLGIFKVKKLSEALNIIEKNNYGNGAMIYTSSGKIARDFQYNLNCGNIGINIGLPAPLAFFPFSGRKDSFFGDLHGQYPDVINFFTEKKVIISRWW